MVEGRIQVRQTGSSTVYPFAVKVAYEFFKKTNKVSPLVESTSTGEGFDNFSIMNSWSDVISASRPIQEGEIKKYKKSGMKSVLEVCIGLDGIAIVANRNLKIFENLNVQDFFMAVAKKIKNSSGKLIDNPYKKWKEINPKLPDMPIRILIPSRFHGTRDAFEQLIMMGQEIRQGDEVREISDYEAADNHHLLFDFLEKNSNVLAFVGMNLLRRYPEVKALKINEIEPSLLNMQNQRYPLMRKLFIYVRRENYKLVEGLQDYINEWLSEDAIGECGYLTQMGLIPLTKGFKKIRML